MFVSLNFNYLIIILLVIDFPIRGSLVGTSCVSL